MGTQQQIPTDGSGSADLRELARVLLETMVNAAMGAQADAPCEDGANVRDGYRERGPATAVGATTMRIPKLRAGTYFPEGIIERHSSADRAAAAADAVGAMPGGRLAPRGGRGRRSRLPRLPG